jgi:hypothetical protein
MKKLKSYHALIALTVILLASATAVAFINSTEKKKQDWTMYYWFDASGSYLDRQNLIDDEISITGYDPSIYAPYTLREKGYAPAHVSGYPPVPNNPFLPDKKLYSHP